MFFSQWFYEFLQAFSEQALTYLLFAVSAFLIFWVWLGRRLKPIRIQETPRAQQHHFWHDLRHSLASMFVFAFIDIALLYLERQGYTQVYFTADRYGWWWLPLSLVLMLVLNDTWFYWTHRAMHHPRLYKFFHRVHHESTDPSPLTSFAFHPSEAVVEYGMHFILPFLFPLHFGVILIWQIIDMLNNVIGHLGYEIYPRGWTKHPVLNLLTTSTHHNMHHQLFHGNYALYFTWWDRWMGTEFKDYSARHEQIFTRQATERNTAGFFALPVANVNVEPNDATSVTFNQPPQVFQDFLPGQHVTLRVRIEDRVYLRTFSLSSTPNSGEPLRLTFKRIPGGVVTNYLADNLQPGQHLELSAPSGNFVVRPEPANRNHYVMIAAGSGITPILSMMGAVLAVEPHSKVTLFYANRRPATVLFQETLGVWSRLYRERLRIEHYFSEEPQPAFGRAGLLNRAVLEAFLATQALESLSFYLCGPELLINQLAADLRYLGVKKSAIHQELFVVGSGQLNGVGVGAQVKATLPSGTFNFTVASGQTILAAAQAQGLPLPFSCQSGLCGTCKLRCTKGKAHLQNNQALTTQEVAAGYILTCQALAETESLELEG